VLTKREPTGSWRLLQPLWMRFMFRQAAKTICNLAATQILFTIAMGIIELFEITIAICTAWMIVAGLLHSLRENR
jgi:hypothetical protein